MLTSAAIRLDMQDRESMQRTDEDAEIRSDSSWPAPRNYSGTRKTYKKLKADPAVNYNIMIFLQSYMEITQHSAIRWSRS